MVRLLPWLLYSGTELRIATRSYQSLHCFPLPRVVLPILQHRKMSSQTKPPAPPRPSSSVIVISPHNEILLLHRVKTSTSFASAHVFPGGNLSTQDGPCPAQDDLARHDDAPWYRRAALRELFEESGILLAREQQGEQGKMLQVAEEKRERGRRAIHQKEVTFADWLGAQNGNAVMDIDNLIPFTRWITPTNVPKRFTTQMYLYFLPLAQRLQDELPTDGDREEIPIPTSDGGVEITEARFLRASEWLRLAQAGEVMLFPPQFLLLHLVAGFLDPPQPAPGPGPGTGTDTAELEKRRQALREFVHSGSPPWTEKCISPKMLKIGDDGRAVLALDQPGPELAGSGRRGETERVVLVRFRKGEAREVEVNWKGSHSRSHL